MKIKIASVVSGMLCAVGITAAYALEPYQNPDLDIDVRVNDLVGRMTLEEKVSQMTSTAQGIERLGIDPYDWWNECLHGVGRAGKATSFPEPIGMAAMWDRGEMFRIADAISDEARAKHHDFKSKGYRQRYQGLTFWTPNINIFRDPRWGRGMETYGEDPYLTGELGVQFVRGLQGDDPKQLKLVATAKHFSVHSGPEYNRHSFDVAPSMRDFKATYTPHFQKVVEQAGVKSVMCAYNRLNGMPCCGSAFLSNLLRDEWGFDGYIVSDCGALGDFFIKGHHEVVETVEEAAALAVEGGTDLNCGGVYPALVKAVEQGLVSEDEIDRAVKRLMKARFQLGMFDPDSLVRWSNIPMSVVESDEHKALERRAAEKSMVLLKNDGNMLPLDKNLKKIAVIGPNADNLDVLLGNYNGYPTSPVTPLAGIRAKLPEAEIRYELGCPLYPRFLNEGRESDPYIRLNALEAAADADAVILCMGISPQLEGEEKGINVEGFKGGDRTDLNLPKIQSDLIKEIMAIGKPTVLVLFNGSPLSINWENENIPAIVEAWYPGQEGGNALANILFGDANPSGKLPLTFYSDISQIPPFEDYNMAGKTYRYFKGEPLYKFGHGLSYTSFDYEITEAPKTIKGGEALNLKVAVKNTGEIKGEAVVELYISHEDTPDQPIRELAGFDRVRLSPGERRVIDMKVDARQLRVLDADDEWCNPKGRLHVSVGGRQPGSAPAGSDEVAETYVKIK